MGDKELFSKLSMPVIAFAIAGTNIYLWAIGNPVPLPVAVGSTAAFVAAVILSFPRVKRYPKVWSVFLEKVFAPWLLLIILAILSRNEELIALMDGDGGIIVALVTVYAWLGVVQGILQFCVPKERP